MKQFITYSLLILVLYAFNYKTINCCFKTADRDSAYFQDYDCEKESSEKSSEKNEKEEKKDISEYLSLNKIHSLTIMHQLSFIKRAKLIFVHSDYSMAVYSPPEKAVI